MRVEAVVTPELDTGIWLSAGLFVVGGIDSGPLVEPNLPRQVRNNKTVGLVAWGGAGADGN